MAAGVAGAELAASEGIAVGAVLTAFCWEASVFIVADSFAAAGVAGVVFTTC